jgi:uncharacterized protein YecT (DUF1311 family)
MKLLLPLLAIVGLMGACTQQSVDKTVSGVDSASAPSACDGVTTPELGDCSAIGLSLEEARMGQYLDAAKVRAAKADADTSNSQPTRQVELLAGSQAAWEKYAELRCEAVLEQFGGEGSVRGLVAQGCRIESTRQRTHDIWTDHLTYRDSTPPVLPEPVQTMSEMLRSAPPPVASTANP